MIGRTKSDIWTDYFDPFLWCTAKVQGLEPQEVRDAPASFYLKTGGRWMLSGLLMLIPYFVWVECFCPLKHDGSLPEGLGRAPFFVFGGLWGMLFAFGYLMVFFAAFTGAGRGLLRLVGVRKPRTTPPRHTYAPAALVRIAASFLSVAILCLPLCFAAGLIHRWLPGQKIVLVAGYEIWGLSALFFACAYHCLVKAGGRKLLRAFGRGNGQEDLPLELHEPEKFRRALKQPALLCITYGTLGIVFGMMVAMYPVLFPWHEPRWYTYFGSGVLAFFLPVAIGGYLLTSGSKIFCRIMQKTESATAQAV